MIDRLPKLSIRAFKKQKRPHGIQPASRRSGTPISSFRNNSLWPEWRRRIAPQAGKAINFNVWNWKKQVGCRGLMCWLGQKCGGSTPALTAGGLPIPLYSLLMLLLAGAGAAENPSNRPIAPSLSGRPPPQSFCPSPPIFQLLRSAIITYRCTP